MSSMTNAVSAKVNKKVGARELAVTAMLSAVAFVLMFLDFPIPFLIPNFVKMDFSELPALLAAFSLGPVYGVMVCLVKNIIHLAITTTAGAGELCNFMLGACFVFPAGLLYHKFKSRKGALVGTLVHPPELLHHLPHLCQLYAHRGHHGPVPADSSLC